MEWLERHWKHSVRNPPEVKAIRVSASTLPVDFNANFHVKALSLEKGRALCNSLVSIKPWKLDDDKTIGKGCNNNIIYDGHGLSLYLITAEIKHLYFYEPKFYLENKCPGENERRRLLEIQSIFTGFFEPKD